MDIYSVFSFSLLSYFICVAILFPLWLMNILPNYFQKLLSNIFEENSLIKALKMGVISIVGIGLLYIIANIVPSSNSTTVLENGEIPGYRQCLEEMMQSNPSAEIKVCCDRVGGDWGKGVMFGTCRKRK